MLSCLSHVQLFATLWTTACQAPLFMDFSKQDYWSGLLCPPPGDCPDSGVELVSRVFCTAGGFFTTEPPGKPHIHTTIYKIDNQHEPTV